DIPSGMPAEGKLPDDNILKADWVITFQRPKLNFLLPLSAPFIKEWKVINIGLDESFIESTPSPFYWFWKKDISKYIRVKNAFDHKGTNGHSLIIAGATETMGAALLCAEASLKSGTGLTTASIPEAGINALNSRLPEIMYLSREEIPHTNLDRYQSVCIGPGLGKSEDSKNLLETIIRNYRKPIVFDADALNILSEDQDLLHTIPANSVLTPHIKEFDRLFGQHSGCWDRIDTAFKQAKALQVYIVLKNRFTMIFSPDGLCYFNSSGSPAMAIGGMGDVLTGMIASFIAQGYTIEKAVLLGVFIHAYTGEHLSQTMYAVPPSKLVKLIPYIMKELKS
ncbi:NAD(P)H-hydrate dehydratase, partial [Pseudoxanthomonas sp. SGD-10]